MATLVWRFGRQIEQIRCEFPDAEIDLVGFSLGGLVAAAWAGQAGDLMGIGRLGLISAPVGGITPLSGLLGIPTVQAVLRQFEIDFGRAAALADIQTGSPWLDLVRRGMSMLPTFAIENAADYVVNGRRICGQVLFPEWVRTIPLGSGVHVTGALPASRVCWIDMGGWDRELRQTHHLILRSGSAEVALAHAWLAEHLADERIVPIPAVAPGERRSARVDLIEAMTGVTL
jgi:pimeloyl-ACP methyl ester carboxylesterase